MEIFDTSHNPHLSLLLAAWLLLHSAVGPVLPVLEQAMKEYLEGYWKSRMLGSRGIQGMKLPIQLPRVLCPEAELHLAVHLDTSSRLFSGLPQEGKRELTVDSLSCRKWTPQTVNAEANIDEPRKIFDALDMAIVFEFRYR